MKVQNEMSTRISVDTISAIGNLSAFRSAISATSSAWRAQEAALRNSGQYSEAVKSRISGLNQVIELQKAKVQELRQQQEGLDQSNSKQATQWVNLERQIAQANRQLVSYEAQVNKAKDNAKYYVSGLANLQHQYSMNSSVTRSYVEALKAEGKTVEAEKREAKGLEVSLKNLEQQRSKQEFLLRQVANSSGKASDAYKKQEIQLNSTRAAIARTNSKYDELKKSLNRSDTSGLEKLRQKIFQVDEAEIHAGKSAVSFKNLLASSVVGGVVTAGLTAITTNFSSIITNGMKVAQVGAAFEARWKNVGVAASGIKELSKQVTDLKTNTNLSAQAVNGLQTRFYGITHSVSQTKTLTQGVASLSDQLKLSGKQADAFAGGLSRIESSGKVTGASLGRLEKQAPGLTAALSKASGMSQKSFDALVRSGKMTSNQFNDILAKASKDYDKNSKAFGQSSGGALHRLQQEWTTTQAKLAKPLLKVSATGLNELSKALDDKNVQKGIQGLAVGMAKIAVAGAKVIGFLAKYSGAVKVAAGATAVLWAYFKTARMVSTFAVGLSKLSMAMKGVSDANKISAASFKALNIAMKANEIGLIITVIGALVAGLVALYKHNAKFRSFVNGIGKSLKGLGKGFVNTGKSILKGADNLHKGVVKAWGNMTKSVTNTAGKLWKGMSNGASNAWKDMEKAASNGASRVQGWYQKLSTGAGKIIQGMEKSHPQIFQNMYKIIGDYSQTWHDLVSGKWNKLSGDTQNISKDLSGAAQDLFHGMYDKLNDLTGGGLDQIKKFWTDTLNNIHDAISNIGSTIHEKWDSLMNGIIDVFGSLVNGVIKGINWVLDKVGGNGNLAEFKVSHFANGSNGPINKHEIAMLNDAPGDEYRELVHKHSTGKTFMMPAKRNILMPLEPGDEVLDGHKTAQMMKLTGPPVPHAFGAVGNFFEGIFDKVGDAIDDATDWVEDALKDVVGFGKSLFNHFIKSVEPKSTDALGSGLKVGFPGFFASRLQAWLKKNLEEMEDDNGDSFTPQMIRKAAAKMKVSVSDADIAHIINVAVHESGNRSRGVQNNWDSNAAKGTPSKGVLQFIDSTFMAYAVAGHKNIWKAFDQLLAMFNDSAWRSDLTLGGWGPTGARRFANGGIATVPSIFGEAGPEMAIPLDISKRGRAYDLLTQVVARFKSEEGGEATVASSESKQMANLNRKFDALLAQNQQLIGLIDKLIGVTDSATNPTARYKRTQHDINMARAQSFV